jgi:hypothetical protein
VYMMEGLRDPKSRFFDSMSEQLTACHYDFLNLVMIGLYAGVSQAMFGLSYFEIMDGSGEKKCASWLHSMNRTPMVLRLRTHHLHLLPSLGRCGYRMMKIRSLSRMLHLRLLSSWICYCLGDRVQSLHEIC